MDLINGKNRSLKSHPKENKNTVVKVLDCSVNSHNWLSKQKLGHDTNAHRWCKLSHSSAHTGHKEDHWFTVVIEFDFTLILTCVLLIFFLSFPIA